MVFHYRNMSPFCITCVFFHCSLFFVVYSSEYKCYWIENMYLMTRKNVVWGFIWLVFCCVTQSAMENYPTGTATFLFAWPRQITMTHCRLCSFLWQNSELLQTLSMSQKDHHSQLALQWQQRLNVTHTCSREKGIDIYY